MNDERRWYPIDWIRLGFLVVFAVLVGATLYARFTAAPGAYGAGHYGGWFPGGGLWLLFLAFLVFGPLRWGLWGRRYWAGPAGRWGRGCGWTDRADEAQHILRERYARGEVTKDQYEAMMRDLRGTERPPS